MTAAIPTQLSFLGTKMHENSDCVIPRRPVVRRRCLYVFCHPSRQTRPGVLSAVEMPPKPAGVPRPQAACGERLSGRINQQADGAGAASGAPAQLADSQ